MRLCRSTHSIVNRTVKSDYYALIQVTLHHVLNESVQRGSCRIFNKIISNVPPGSLHKMHYKVICSNREKRNSFKCALLYLSVHLLNFYRTFLFRGRIFILLIIFILYLFCASSARICKFNSLSLSRGEKKIKTKIITSFTLSAMKKAYVPAHRAI